MHNENEFLAARVAHLEREIKRQRWFNTALLLLAIAAFGALGTRSQSVAQNTVQSTLNEVRCKSLVIVGEDGQERVFASSDKSGGFVVINAPDGRNRVLLGVEPNGGLVQIRNNLRQPIAVLAAGKDGGQINVADHDGKNVGFLGSAPGNRGEVSVSAGGQDMLIGGSDETGGFFVVNGATGRNVVRLLSDMNGGRVEVRDHNGAVQKSVP